MWLSPFTCPWPPMCMVGSPFPSPLRSWLGRTAALLPTDRAAISPFRELKQPTARCKNKNSFWLGWLSALTHCASEHQSEGSGELDLLVAWWAEPYPKAAPRAWPCSRVGPWQDLQCQSAGRNWCSQADVPWTVLLCGSLHFRSKMQRWAPDVSPTWNKKPGQGLSRQHKTSCR